MICWTSLFIFHAVVVVLRLENVEELATNHEEANIKMFFSFITRIGARMEKKSHAL